MARNEEKAQSMLNRYLRMKEEERTGGKAAQPRRPRDPSDCTSLNEAEKWRMQVLRTLTGKVSEIQNLSLPENTIRDLNDNINRLLTIKRVWERRILELGGPNYFASPTAKISDANGKDPGQVNGYRYFGAAKELPGVQDILESDQLPIVPDGEKNRFELQKHVDADYFGYGFDDSELIKLEYAVEQEAIKAAVVEFHNNKTVN